MPPIHRCPECMADAHFRSIGPHRSMCGKCSAIIKNSELDKVSILPVEDEEDMDAA